MASLNAIEASQRFRNRMVVTVFGIAALVFLVGPFVVKWWGQRDFCPSIVTAKGRSSGTDWAVTKADCGPEVGVVWQVRIIPTKGVSNLAYDARGGPEPVSYEQSGFTGTIKLANAPIGSSETTVAIAIGHGGRPVAPVRFQNGQRLP